MKFNENIRTLRKQKGYSQEQLAEILNVSRQAISKWESENAYPEMETLFVLCDIFEVSMDDLMKKDLANEPLDDRQESRACFAFIQRCAKAYALGVFTILVGLVLFLFISITFPEDTPQEIVPISVFLFFVLMGVLILTYTGIKDMKFKKEHPILSNDMLTTSEKEIWYHRFTIAIAGGVGLIIAGLILQLLLEAILYEGIATAIFMCFVAMAVYLFVYYGYIYSFVLQPQKDMEEIKKEKKKEDKIGGLCGIIMLVAVMIYITCGFLLGEWGSAWVVFPIGGILCAIVAIFIDSFSKD